MIGLIDLDLLYTKTLSQPNYELCVVATYYKLQGKDIRLILDTSISNLKCYDKIYLFKSHYYGKKPSEIIKDYYKLSNVEEYGEGLPNRPLHPNLPELVYVNPDASIYFPLINYLEKNSGKQFRLKRKGWFTKYSLVKQFYDDDGELLTRQLTNDKMKKILIYDNPLIFFTNTKGKLLLSELLKSSKTIQFAVPLDVSKLSEDCFELLMTGDKLTSLRTTLYISETNANVKKFMLWCEAHKDNLRPSRLSVKLQDSDDYRYYLLNSLRIMNTLPARVGDKIKLYPKMDYSVRKKHYLIRYLYSWQRGHNGSFYEYVIWRAYRKEIERNRLIGKIDAWTIDFLFKTYGMRTPLIELETIMFGNSEAESLIMKGGKSYYGNERIKHSYIGGTPRPFKGDNYKPGKYWVSTTKPNRYDRRNRTSNK